MLMPFIIFFRTHVTRMRNMHNERYAYITKTRLYNFDPLKPNFYIVKLGFTGVYIIFLISAQKHRLWELFDCINTIKCGIRQPVKFQ